MILPTLSCLVLLLPLTYAATLPLQLDVNAPSDTSLDIRLPYFGVNVPGQNLLVRCNSGLGAGLEARSCFNALSFAPDGTQQEIFLASNAAAGLPGNRLPIAIISSESANRRVYSSLLYRILESRSWTDGTVKMTLRVFSGHTYHPVRPLVTPAL